MGFRTQAQVDKLRLAEGKSDAFVWDDECIGLSVRLQGRARRWVVWYQARGARHRVTLGAVAGLSLKEARIKAGRIVSDAREGKGVLEARQAIKAKAANTFGHLVELYLERRAKPRQRPRTYIETERYLLKRWSPLHARPVDSVSRGDLAARLEEIRVDHGAGAAEKARVYLGMAYSWAMRQGLVDHSPVLGLEPTPPKRRDRVLTQAELASVWHACDGASDFGALVKLLMLTAQRRHEAAGLHRSELDLDRALWILPAARTKNDREHEVPLSRQALELVAPLAGPFLFGRGGRTPYSGFSRAKARLDRDAGVSPWTLHDIRRSAITHMNEIGVDPHVIEAVVNHVSGARGGIAGRYNFAAYREQKRKALQNWADWLEAVVDDREPSSNFVAWRGRL